MNKSLVTNWFDISSNITRKTTWEELDPRSRFLHGGPWNDPDTLQIHISNMIKFGHIDLLIDKSDNLWGMMEYHYSKAFVHLDWMMIHPNAQRKGLGSKLLEKLVNETKKLGSKLIITEVESGVEDFYHNFGFRMNDYSYFRYENKRKNNKKVKITDISLSEIDLKSRIGEENNTDEYLKHLLSTSISYAELFTQPYPLSQIENNNFQIIVRDISGFTNKSSIFFAGVENGVNISQILQNQDLLDTKVYYYTSKRKMKLNWDLMKIIKSMYFKIDARI